MKKWLIIFSSVLAVITIIVFLVQLNAKYNMRNYFDGWVSETDCNYVRIINNFPDIYDCNGDFIISMEDILPKGIISTVYCLKDDKIFFSYSTKNAETGDMSVWHIASVDTSGENLKELLSCVLFDGSIKNPVFRDLSCCSDKSDKFGGLYYDGKIYLHGNIKTIVFDPITEVSEEISDLPSFGYMWQNDKQTLNIKDTGSDTVRTITLNSMAQHNSYAKKLLELSERKIWNGNTPVDEVFSYVKVIDNQPYIVCNILNWNGESFAVLFKYDFSADVVYYVLSCKVGGIISNQFAFAPYI